MTYLVTGGAGSIGSEVVRRLVRDGESVRVMDINEEGLWALKVELPDVDIRLGDVTRREDCVSAASNVSAVIHCAAVKHVDLCEAHPMVAWRVNAEGARNMREVSDARFVLLSTDKAIYPASVMGRTKAAAEAQVIKSGGNVVRFGNVIGTRGSLVPSILRYRAAGRPLRMTNPAMTRFWMTVDEAVDLILTAARNESCGRTFSPQHLRSSTIGDFIEVCRDMLEPGYPIERVPTRGGERLHEFMEFRGGFAQSDDPRFLMDRAAIEQFIADSGVLAGVTA